MLQTFAGSVNPLGSATGSDVSWCLQRNKGFQRSTGMRCELQLRCSLIRPFHFGGHCREVLALCTLRLLPTGNNADEEILANKKTTTAQVLSNDT